MVDFSAHMCGPTMINLAQEQGGAQFRDFVLSWMLSRDPNSDLISSSFQWDWFTIIALDVWAVMSAPKFSLHCPHHWCRLDSPRSIQFWSGSWTSNGCTTSESTNDVLHAPSCHRSLLWWNWPNSWKHAATKNLSVNPNLLVLQSNFEMFSFSETNWTTSSHCLSCEFSWQLVRFTQKLWFWISLHQTKWDSLALGHQASNCEFTPPSLCDDTNLSFFPITCFWACKTIDTVPMSPSSAWVAHLVLHFCSLIHTISHLFWKMMICPNTVDLLTSKEDMQWPWMSHQWSVKNSGTRQGLNQRFCAFMNTSTASTGF